MLIVIVLTTLYIQLQFLWIEDSSLLYNNRREGWSCGSSVIGGFKVFEDDEGFFLSTMREAER